MESNRVSIAESEFHGGFNFIIVYNHWMFEVQTARIERNFSGWLAALENAFTMLSGHMKKDEYEELETEFLTVSNKILAYDRIRNTLSMVGRFNAPIDNNVLNNLRTFEVKIRKIALREGFETKIKDKPEFALDSST